MKLKDVVFWVLFLVVFYVFLTMIGAVLSPSSSDPRMYPLSQLTQLKEL